MVKRCLALAAVLTLVAGMGDAFARGGGKLQALDKPMTAEQLRLFNDPPQSHLNAEGYAARQATPLACRPEPRPGPCC